MFNVHIKLIENDVMLLKLIVECVMKMKLIHRYNVLFDDFNSI